MQGNPPVRSAVLLWLLLAVALVPRAFAAQPGSTEIFIAINAMQVSIPAATHGTIHLEGPWSFHEGDDARWSDPSFDDTSWDKVMLGTPFNEQGIDTYTGYAWYRIRIQLQPNSKAAETQLALLVTPYSVGQLEVFVNGVETGQTRGMASHMEYLTGPFINTLPKPQPDGTILIAIRSWVSGSVVHGLVNQVTIGGPDHIQESYLLAKARHWDQNIAAKIIAGFLFFCVALVAATLYIAQRHHSEYLWLCILCLSITVRGSLEAAFALAWVPLRVYDLLQPWTVWFFFASTLEFVLRFTGNATRRFVRIIQIGALLLPLASDFQLYRVSGYLGYLIEIVFCALVVLMLFRAWRKGRSETGVMLVPFILAAVVDSIDTLLGVAASWKWIPESYATPNFHLGPIQYSVSTVTDLVFLGSLISVIFYRFIRVSQDEQRSSAEIEAARSVQALLIPTQLPSNRNFLLESAYLPVSGVGGDFFQVLPLKDDSMLIVVGDVSGKGLQAAMSASTLVGALRNELSNDPATILAHLNQVMLGNVLEPSGKSGTNAVAGFATCLCARIYPDGRMVIANAGHLSPYRDGRELELSPCLPLGVIPNVEYEQATLQLKHGDRLIFLSDGVVEATDPKGELFGFERTQQVSHESPRYIAQTAQRFGQNDDITVVGLYFVPA
ncbi:SpoIIE family protein phosphatase [Acidicapsa dinghuensis]|uniref:SpoIIE family protein phosphatase n=1 Tax=Acidicapsa dinghuensis TaxID=2218256 RepID=A0ABW1EMN3_9BACT|nr:SpoIIE family protein phosphatase [Acidicapsa dinghuensis]